MLTSPWYHRTTIYQIYPRSFYDSNGDGIGDLQGIIQKLDYIHELGFETIWISPFFSSPQADFGYDISDYTDISPEYGTIDDVLQLIDEVHQRGMKIVFDMVMNHTSIEHPWFIESRSSFDNPKADWYIWRDEPNNWQSMVGGNGWHYTPERGQYFWASFLPFQPDLNYHNPQVKQAMLDIIRFWFDRGVDGYRLDIFNVIYKDAEFRNNPFTFKLVPTEQDPSAFFQKAEYTLNQPENYGFAKELRSVTEEFGERMLLGEVSGNRETIRKYLGKVGNDGLGLVFDFEMMNFQFTATYFRNIIQEMEAHYPNPFMPVYVFSNHDRSRSIRWINGDMQKAKLLHLLQFTVRGVPCMYYGEEIGMTNLKLPFSSALDPIPHRFKFIPRFIPDALGLTINRDEVRTPMQWNATKNAGFSSAEKTWLPVHENYKDINVEKQCKDNTSLLNTIRSLLAIRNKWATFHEGGLTLINGLPKYVLGYRRELGDERLTVLINFSAQKTNFSYEFSNCIFKLSSVDQAKEKAIQMNGLSGMILT